MRTGRCDADRPRGSTQSRRCPACWWGVSEQEHVATSQTATLKIRESQRNAATRFLNSSESLHESGDGPRAAVLSYLILSWAGSRYCNNAMAACCLLVRGAAAIALASRAGPPLVAASVVVAAAGVAKMAPEARWHVRKREPLHADLLVQPGLAAACQIKFLRMSCARVLVLSPPFLLY